MLSPFDTLSKDSMSKINYIITFVLFAFHCSATHSLEFSIHGNNSKTLTAVSGTGSVVGDDSERLERFLLNLPRKSNSALYLNSRGGSLSGGMKLGKYLRKNRIKAVVEGGEICASACALAFLGGTDNFGKKWMSTTTTSRLGFHSFRNADGSRHQNSDDTQQVVAVVLEYGKFVDAPMDIFIRTFQTASDEMYWFTVPEALNLGIKVWSMEKKCFVGEPRCN
jgi:hypothetical protein